MRKKNRGIFLILSGVIGLALLSDLRMLALGILFFQVSLMLYDYGTEEESNPSPGP